MSEHLKSAEKIHSVDPEIGDGSTEKRLESTVSSGEALLGTKEIRKTVEDAERQSTQTEDIKKVLEAQPDENNMPQYAGRDLKRLMLNRTMHKIQNQLPRSQRLLSKIIHQPVIDRLSEASG